MSARRMLRRLNPKTKNYRDLVDDSNHPAYPAGDLLVTMSYAGIEDGVIGMLRLKYNNDNTHAEKYVDWALGIAVDLIRASKKYRRQHKDARHLHKVVQAAIISVISPRLCHACLGRGGKFTENKYEECLYCKGEGTGKMPDRLLCRILDIPWSSWNERWKYIYRDVSRELIYREREALRLLGEH